MSQCGKCSEEEIQVPGWAQWGPAWAAVSVKLLLERFPGGSQVPVVSGRVEEGLGGCWSAKEAGRPSVESCSQECQAQAICSI